MITKDAITQRRRNLTDQQYALLEKRLHGKLKNLKNDTTAPPNIPKRPTDSQPPLSFSQQRLWFLHQIEADSAVYNIPQALHLAGKLNIEALEKSLNAVISRHEALRTTFPLANKRPVQNILAEMILPLPVVDLTTSTALNKADRVRKADQLGAEMAQQPFDLEAGPLIRAKLVRLGDDEYLFFLTVHHIVFDKWSSDILWREMGACYQAFTTGETPTLPEPSIQFADFAQWQHHRLQGDYLETLLAYWQARLGNEPAILQLPTDHSRPTVQSFQGANCTRLLPVHLTEQLTVLSRRTGATLFMTLLAAFKTLLYRYTQQDDIIIGTPIANRNHAQLEDVLGFFVNTLVLRTDLSDDPDFLTLLKRVRDISLDAYSHQEMPFEKLVEVLNPERDMGHNPLFQVMFVFQNAMRTSLAFPGLTVTRRTVKTQTAKFDLSLEMSNTADGLRTLLEYNTALFNAATIERMLDHFQVLLEGIIASPTQPISSLPLLTTPERKQILETWNGSPVDYAAIPIHQLFEAQVARTPNAVALRIEDKHLTYAELNTRANQVAHYLMAQGILVETVVGICMERSFDMVVSLLAILKAGGAYLPLDPAYPQARLQFMVSDAQPPFIITNRLFCPLFDGSDSHIISLDIFNQQNQPYQDNPETSVTVDNLAYILYTSGSTGQPKGVMGLHRGAVNRFHWMWRTYPFTAKDVCCQKTTLNFVDAVWEIFGPLLQGAPTVLIPDETLKDPHQFVQTLAENHVTRLVVVPSLLRVLLDTYPDLATQLPSLAHCVTSGEALSVDLAHLFLTAMPNGMLINLYGSSEVAADVTAFEVRSDTIEDAVPIGQPIDNTNIYILDKHLNPVPCGVHGEIYVGGDGLARGYLNRPALTAERFIGVNDLRLGSDTCKLFRTGDVGRYRTDSTGTPIIEYIGRRDQQVKIRGFRIEVAEIEHALNQHPDLLENVVLPALEEKSQTRLLAYIVPKPNHEITTTALRRFLSERLPETMIPSTFILLRSLPLTPNGKVDRLALPAPDKTRRDDVTAYIAPSNELEHQLVQLWQAVLHVEPVGVVDNFFNLGGHSLLAVDLFGQIEDVLGVRLPLVTLFQAPTIVQLAANLQQKGWQPTKSALVPIQPHGSNPPIFCVTPPRGSVLGFAGLAQHLGQDQPFYGLHYEGIENWKIKPSGEPVHPITDIAAHYLQEIKRIQPDGPYYLGGRCYGAHVAFEMAQQLVLQGETVALLALMTTHPRGYQRPRLHYVRRGIYHLRQRQLKRILDRGLPRMLPKFRRKLQNRIHQIFWPQRGHTLKIDAPQSDHTARYVQRVYPGHITLFQTSDATEDAWAKLASGGIDLHLIPGSHLDVFHEPNIQLLAKKLADSIANAQSAPNAPAH